MLSRILKSTIVSWVILLLIAAVLIATYKIHPVWWTFIDIFFFFIMAFCHAMSCSFAKINPAASRRLDIISLVCGCAGIIAFLVEYILLNYMN